MKEISAFLKNVDREERHTKGAWHPKRHPDVRYHDVNRNSFAGHAGSGKTSHHKAYRPQSILTRARNNSSILTQIRQNYKPKPLHARSVNRQTNNSGAEKPQQNKSTHKTQAHSSSFSMPLLPALGFLFLGTMLLAYNWNNITLLLQKDVVAEGQGTIVRAGNTGTSTPKIPDITGFSEIIDTSLFTAGAVNNIIYPSVIIQNGTLPAQSDENAEIGEAQDEEIPLKTTEYFAWLSHTVKSGESVSKIAASYGLSIDAVVASNDLTNAHLVRVGQTLRIPNMNGIPYTVKKGDNLSAISKAWNIPLAIIVSANNLQNDTIYPGQTIFLPGARMPANALKLALGGTLFENPLKGVNARLTSTFGWRTDPFDGVQRHHEALDLAAPTGTTVKAAAAGKVSMVSTSAVYGRYIIISHSDNMQTLYAHLSAVSVKNGDSVNQGAKIGEVGSTGRSTGPHLHFAVYKNGNAVNPLDYLKL